MINRLLEKRIQLSKDENLAKLGTPIELEYCLTESRVDDMDELSGKMVYGIEIVKRVKGMTDEVEVVKNLSCCMEKTKDVLEILMRNTVTPVGLPFVLDDIVGI